MRPTQFSADTVVALLREHTVASLQLLTVQRRRRYSLTGETQANIAGQRVLAAAAADPVLAQAAAEEVVAVSAACFTEVTRGCMSGREVRFLFQAVVHAALDHRQPSSG